MFRSKMDLNELELRGRSGNIKPTTSIYILLNFPPTHKGLFVAVVFLTGVHRCSCVLINVHGPSQGVIMQGTLGNGMHRFPSPVASSAVFSLHSVCIEVERRAAVQHPQTMISILDALHWLSFLFTVFSECSGPTCLLWRPGERMRPHAHTVTSEVSFLNSFSWNGNIDRKRNESVMTGTCDSCTVLASIILLNNPWLHVNCLKKYVRITE